MAGKAQLSSSAMCEVAAAPDLVFDTLIDIAAMPDWNAVMVDVVEQPVAMSPGAQWAVRFRAMGMYWQSRSTLIELDRSRRRFAHRSGTDDGNPSYTDWRWSVIPSGTGARIAVDWALHPQTFWRRRLMAPLRARQLRREVAESLVALGVLAASRAGDRAAAE